MKSFWVSVCATLVLAACADPVVPRNLSWDPTTQAKIITDRRLQSECIAPVQIYEIDGQMTFVNTLLFLESGIHTLKAQGFVNTAGCPVLDIPRNYSIPPLEAEFEAGMVYYLGMDHGPRNIADWRVVIWKIENGLENPFGASEAQPQTGLNE